MPDDRLFHKKLGHSVKVNELTDFEDIVWRTYILAADDFGVMRFLSLPLQNAMKRLESRSARVVQRALERVEAVGLVRTFVHQGQRYCYQHDWQLYQKLEYPRATTQPRPPDADLEDCDLSTQHLFRFHPGGCRVPGFKLPNSEKIPGGFGENSENFPVPRARTRALTATGYRLTATGGGVGEVALETPPSDVSDEVAARAGRFCERYAALYQEHRHGAFYHGKPALDFQEAIGLVSTWDDARLEQLVIAFLTTDEPFCRNGSGTIPQFRSRASWCDTKLRQAGL